MPKQRRGFLAAVAAVGSTLLAGCTATGREIIETEDKGDSQQEPTTKPAKSLQVRISHISEWSGSVGADDGMRPVEGDGPRIFDIDNDADIVSANAQKMDGSGATLAITVLKDAEIVKQVTTSEEYGFTQLVYETSES